jgi:antagonist of KipI
MRFADDRLVAWCGGDFDIRVADCLVPAGHACRIGTGEEIAIKGAGVGCRLWLAISGGVDVPLVLGSRATDLRAEFGGLDGHALLDEDELPVGESSTIAKSRMKSLGGSRVSAWSAQKEWSLPASRNVSLRFVRGSDWNLFGDSAHDAFATAKFVVTPEADRMAARLDGPELKRNETHDLLSEAVAPGTVQVPPDGKPILLLGDCQTIGGYPKIGHVITVDLPIAAQLRAGDDVRFHEVSVSEAHSALIARERDLAIFRTGLSLRDS